MNSQITKRRNPFETPKFQEEKSKIQEEEKEIEQEEQIEEKEAVVPVKKVIQPTPNYQKPSRSTARNKSYEVDDGQKDKYTSTMDTKLRRRIKIICATRGIMFAEFVTEACLEKLSREEGK